MNIDTTICLFIPQLMGMGYFQFGDIINNAAMNIYLQVFNGNMFLILLGIYLGVELLDYMVCLHLTF